MNPDVLFLAVIFAAGFLMIMVAIGGISKHRKEVNARNSLEKRALERGHLNGHTSNKEWERVVEDSLKVSQERRGETTGD
jgi:Flp pilus assembly protein TadB